MPVEIQMLVCSVVLLAVIIAVQALAGVLQKGVMPDLGNRDDIARSRAGRRVRSVAKTIR